MKIRSNICGVRVGDGAPTRIMGVINVSPESFFKGSISRHGRTLIKKVRHMTESGADFIDVGAMSTSPYLKSQVSENKETERLLWAIKLIKKNSSLPISVDSTRPGPAFRAIKAGAQILNDVHGLQNVDMTHVACHAKALILMAYPEKKSTVLKNPVAHVTSILKRSLQRAREAGIPSTQLVVDPGIGFFRDTAMPWWKWDLAILKNLKKLRTLKTPVLVGVSRKSFIGKILGDLKPADRLVGSLGATAGAIVNGAHIIRTHDVKETKEMIELLNRTMD